MKYKANPGDRLLHIEYCHVIREDCEWDRGIFCIPPPLKPQPTPSKTTTTPLRSANLPNGTVLYITIEVQRWPTINIHRGLREDQ